MFLPASFTLGESMKDGNDMEKQRNFKKFLYSNNTAGYVFSLPFIVGFLGFTLIPILVSMYYSVTDYKLGKEANYRTISIFLRMNVL